MLVSVTDLSLGGLVCHWVRDVRAPGKVTSLCVIIGLGFFFLEFVEVSVLSLVVHCCSGGFSYGLHVGGGFWFIEFRPVRSSVVSTDSTGRFGVGQGQRGLAQGMRDGL